MKKILALLLVLVMAMSLTTAVFADETTQATETTYSITITPNDDYKHTYEAYRIFKGVLTETKNEQGNVTNRVLTNIEWGDNVDTDNLTDLMDFINTLISNDEAKLTSDSNAADYAEAIGNLKLDDDSENARKLAKIFEEALNDADAKGTVTTTGNKAAGTIEGLPAGYYLVKDKDNSLVDEDDNKVDAAYTRYILSIVSNVTVTAKSEKPTIEKKVWDVNDSTSTETTPTVTTYNGLVSELWMDSADHDIGDTVWYKVTFTIPANTLNNYDSYTLTITDTLSKGLTYNKESSTVNRLTYDVSIMFGNTDDADYFKVTSQINDDGTTTLTLKPQKNDIDDLIEILNRNDSNANLSEEYVFVWTYSCTLNENAVIDSKGNPNDVYLEYSNNPNGEDMGKTAKDTNIVFTYQVDVSKIDGEEKPLNGAEFALFKKIKGTVGTSWTEWTEGTAVTAGTTYYKTAEEDCYWLYIDTIKPLKSDDGSSAIGSYKGIDDGVYQLIETVTPAGYNSIKPIEFTVSATHNNDPEELKLGELKANSTDATFAIKSLVDGDVICENAIVATTIKNNAGSTLPSTGGIGTTIFYTVGGILVVAAVILLVTKKRMSAED